MKKTLTRQIVVAVLVLAFATGCAGMSTRQQQALSGGAIGAGGGAWSSARLLALRSPVPS
ncbi:MAG: hypothetical protein HW395_598 [candidate division NC10 bacterium]|nr:hypothetical protein [candidate division NC10 bacterium]